MLPDEDEMKEVKLPLDGPKSVIVFDTELNTTIAVFKHHWKLNVYMTISISHADNIDDGVISSFAYREFCELARDTENWGLEKLISSKDFQEVI